MKLNKLIAIATISLLSGGISMAQKALNLEDIVPVTSYKQKASEA